MVLLCIDMGHNGGEFMGKKSRIQLWTNSTEMPIRYQREII